jgi:hypothetical protein
MRVRIILSILYCISLSCITTEYLRLPNPHDRWCALMIRVNVTEVLITQHHRFVWIDYLSSTTLIKIKQPVYTVLSVDWTLHNKLVPTLQSNISPWSPTHLVEKGWYLILKWALAANCILFDTSSTQFRSFTTMIADSTYPVTDKHRKCVRSYQERNYANKVTFKRVRTYFLLVLIKYITVLNQPQGKVHVMSWTCEQKKYNSCRKITAVEVG